ncbi:MAG: hypothetical protein GEU82_15640 [Luteitalea sp.]|nr:hypothetical protein [Luteitalea sp.]
MNTVDDLVTQLTGEQARAAAAIAALRASREQVMANLRQLEGPNAALEHIDYFVDLFGRGAVELGRVAAELPQGTQQAHIDAIRQLASNSAAEQRRSVLFRDKWINKPLPYEQMRSVLNGISNTTREQLDAFRALTEMASALESARGELKGEDTKGFDRRALFTRLFKPPTDGDSR